MAHQPSASPWVQDLNGEWEFRLVPPPPQDSPQGFWEEGFDASQWDSIQVPGNWTMQGHEWVNGQKVGYSQGSRLPAEFDIAGIYRDVTLYSLVEVHLWDVFARPVLDEQYQDATLLCKPDLKRPSRALLPPT